MKAHEIFLRAPVGATPGELAAFLAGACDGNAALRAEVEELFAKDADGCTVGAAKHGAEAHGNDIDMDKAGGRIGRYKLLQQIGEGGFGTVWMAEQEEPVRRRVALKIIKAGMDTREVIARFEAESQAVAMMDHPNIAKVFDAGATERGRPYFVMELVKGIPITRFCDEQKLNTRARLLLFTDVCSAINHAHQKGVIHRDIKPSNVMVTMEADKPLVKVIDFGIAKATQQKLTDKTLFTRFEQFIGTPAYMSPEQAALSSLDIDTRSDIYALGILLYELLTGAPPFNPNTLIQAGYDEMRRIIREVDPPKPSARLGTIVGDERTTLASARHISPERLGRLVEPDLDWIVMKSIEKDRKLRYETANAFALDIQHYLYDEPVSATPPSAGYKLKKFARRHRVGLRIAGLCALLLVGGTVASTLLAFRASRAEQEVTRQLKKAETARQEAEEIAEFLSGILESPDPNRNDRLITVAESLDRAAARIENSLSNSPDKQIRVKIALGRAYAGLGYPEKALPLQESVLAWLKETEGDESPETIDAIKNLAATLDSLSRRKEAIKLFAKVLQWYAQHLGPDHKETSLLKSELGRVTWVDGDQKGKSEGIALMEQALAQCRKNPGMENVRTHSLLHWLAVMYTDAGRIEEARALDEEHLERSRKQLGEKHTQTLRARSAAASHITDPIRRIAVQQEIAADSAVVYGADHPYSLAMLAQQAISVKESGDTELAIQLHEDILQQMKKKNGLEHADTIWIMGSLASLLDQTGEATRAMEMRRDVVALNRTVFGEQHHNTLGAKMRLASSLETSGRTQEAIALQEEILPLLEKLRGVDHADTTGVQNALRKNYGLVGRLKDALRMREHSLAACIAKNGAGSLSAIQLRHTIAYEMRMAGQPEAALAYSAETLRITRQLKSFPSRDMWLRYSLYSLGWHCEKSDLKAESEKWKAERLALIPKPSAVRTMLIRENAEWSWLHPLDGQDPETVIPGFHQQFAQPDFDDSGWSTSAMTGDGFGYGEGFKGVDIGTPTSATRHVAYFRCRFNVTGTHRNLELRARRDDGMIVYLDGKEVLRDNVPNTPNSWSLTAAMGVDDLEHAVTGVWSIPGHLAPGEHILAISLHNFFDADLLLGNLSLVETE